MIHMKRTNLVSNEELLEEATRLSGERTYSRTVERALEDFVRRIKARRILELTGSGLWEGDLSEMRGDRAAEKRKAYKRVPRRSLRLHPNFSKRKNSSNRIHSGAGDSGYLSAGNPGGPPGISR